MILLMLIKIVVVIICGLIMYYIMEGW
jgi:hypothetical protein